MALKNIPTVKVSPFGFFTTERKSKNGDDVNAE